eukprot:CAMPEP_0175086252 /NCGR_PEP_ID=MMETSP0052_2-20121109/29136_1 /TAXON_ID=51329 ORGANISM="Polytomella parva, Strain SAG 63-3" /NCGR_SAMPLE_ID=MMETSP0052_2 /ASSEMBLY_ACC=CAM_ASM_000194 /LENGTH=56 /DNA_ID=CAMNT_0016358395 /DNA_START=410 /DNA_END=580 /DNA_ORIENTATION=+
MTTTSLRMTTAKAKLENGPFPPISLSTAMAEAGERASISVAPRDEMALAKLGLMPS